MAEGIDALVLDVKTRRRRVHEVVRRLEGAGRDDDRDRPRHGQEGRRPHHRHGAAPRPDRGQRSRGGGVHRDPEGPRAQGPRIALHRARGLDAPPRRASARLDAARTRVRDALHSAEPACASSEEIIELQGGDPRVCDDLSLLPQARRDARSCAPSATAGSTRIACRAVGQAGDAARGRPRDRRQRDRSRGGPRPPQEGGRPRDRWASPSLTLHVERPRAAWTRSPRIAARGDRPGRLRGRPPASPLDPRRSSPEEAPPWNASSRWSACSSSWASPRPSRRTARRSGPHGPLGPRPPVRPRPLRAQDAARARTSSRGSAPRSREC